MCDKICNPSGSPFLLANPFAMIKTFDNQPFQLGDEYQALIQG